MTFAPTGAWRAAHWSHGWLARGLAAGLGALMLAGVVHIAIVLLVPRYAPLDGWSRLAALAAGDRLTPLAKDENGLDPVPGLDPLFAHGVCRLSLAQAPASLVLRAPERFWSVALYDSDGIAAFSLNDRTAGAAESLDMLVATPAQNAEIRKGAQEDIAETIVVETEAEELIALVRLYAPTEAARREAEAAIADAACAPAPIERVG